MQISRTFKVFLCITVILIHLVSAKDCTLCSLYTRSYRVVEQLRGQALDPDFIQILLEHKLARLTLGNLLNLIVFCVPLL